MTSPWQRHPCWHPQTYPPGLWVPEIMQIKQMTNIIKIFLKYCHEKKRLLKQKIKIKPWVV